MVFVPEKVVFASEPPNHVREITPMAERGVGKRPGAPAPAPATAKRGRGGGGRGGGRKIPVAAQWRTLWRSGVLRALAAATKVLCGKRPGCMSQGAGCEGSCSTPSIESLDARGSRGESNQS